MKKRYIKKFEAFTVDKNDSIESKSSKQYYNKTDSDIKEFNSKKITVQNIYKTYKTDSELIRTLLAQKLIDPKTPIPPLTNNQNTQVKSPVFLNEIMGLYAQICKNERQISDITNKIKESKDSIDKKNQIIQDNPDMKDYVTKHIEKDNLDIKNYNEKINNLHKEILNLNKTIKETMDNMLKKLKDYKYNIDKSNQNSIA